MGQIVPFSNYDYCWLNDDGSFGGFLDHLGKPLAGVGVGTGLQPVNNLSDLNSAATARANLGLGNVNNTSDAAKPVSDATQLLLNGKLPNAAGAVGTSNLAARSIGAAQLAAASPGTYLGRHTSGSGDLEQVPVATVASDLAPSLAPQSLAYNASFRLDNPVGWDMGLHILASNETISAAGSPAPILNGACVAQIVLTGAYTFGFAAGISVELSGVDAIVAEDGAVYEVALVSRPTGVRALVTKTAFLYDTTSPLLGTPHVEDGARSDILVPITELHSPTLNGTTAGITLGGAAASGKTVSAVAIVSGNLKITLSAPLAYGDVLTVAIAAGMVKDANNNLSVAKSATGVTNNIVASGRHDNMNRTGSFNQALGTPSDAGTPWEIANSGYAPNGVELYGNGEARTTAYGRAVAALECTLNVGLVQVGCYPSGGGVGVAIHYVDGDHFAAFICDMSGTQFRLVKNTGGVSDIVSPVAFSGASGTDTNPAYDVLRTLSITVSGDGTNLLCKSGTTTIFNVTGADLGTLSAAGTKHGFFLDNISNVAHSFDFTP